MEFEDHLYTYILVIVVSNIWPSKFMGFNRQPHKLESATNVIDIDIIQHYGLIHTVDSSLWWKNQSW